MSDVCVGNEMKELSYKTYCTNQIIILKWSTFNIFNDRSHTGHWVRPHHSEASPLLPCCASLTPQLVDGWFEWLSIFMNPLNWISSFGSPPHTQICFLIHTKSSENSMTFNIWRGDARVLYILPRVRDEQKHRTTPQLLRLCLSAVASIGSPTGPNRSHWTITPRNQSKGEVSIQAEFSLLSWANIIDTPLQGSFH